MSEQRQLSLKDDGICPLCGSPRIHAGDDIDGKQGLRGSNRIPMNALHHAVLDNFVCVECGYVESYITDRTALTQIQNEWPRVIPPPPEQG